MQKACRRENIHIGFCLGILREIDHLENLDVDVRIKSK
jgi:hypothetical protein